MEEKWFGQKCKNQICQFETDGDGIEDKSEPVLIYCNHEDNEDGCEGNCRLSICPIRKKDN